MIPDKLLQLLNEFTSSAQWSVLREYLEQRQAALDKELRTAEGTQLLKLQGKSVLVTELLSLRETVINEYKSRKAAHD